MKFSSFYRSFHSTTISLNNKFIPSKHPYVIGLYDFFQGGYTNPVTLPTTKALLTGRSWTASELRRKSFEDLHKIWYILLKERNLLATMWEEAKRFNRINNPEWRQRHDDRRFKTQKSMARIKFVLSERRVAYEYARRADPNLFGLEAPPKPQKYYVDDGKPNYWRDGPPSRIQSKTTSRIPRQK
ncbi:5265_t:CDS:2 [Diversispora eburnea]|uniref:Large ribosomal subunit protein uL29m n=1 Tax=Diversispora eburnea TaxID=1213867 RepID=A0A9N9AUT9_9GLOM|nr:5265_t:CDS:2 [Diversispora eburnea]